MAGRPGDARENFGRVYFVDKNNTGISSTLLAAGAPMAMLRTDMSRIYISSAAPTMNASQISSGLPERARPR